MKFRKTIVTLSTAAMLFASVTPISAFAAANKSIELNPISSHILTVKGNATSKAVVKAGSIVTPYIQLGKDNFYHLDPKVKSLVSDDVFKSYSLAVDSMNQAIEQKLVKIVNGQPVAVKSADAGASSIHTEAFSSWHWWGVAVTFNEQETQDEIYWLNQTGQAWVLIAAIGGAASIANPPAGAAAALAATCVAVGSFMIANSMSHSDRGNGVTLNLHWVPPYFTTNPN